MKTNLTESQLVIRAKKCLAKITMEDSKRYKEIKMSFVRRTINENKELGIEYNYKYKYRVEINLETALIKITTYGKTYNIQF